MKTWVAIAFLWLGTTAQAAVWETRNQWSNEWEQTYSNWIRDHWSQTTFTDAESPYKGLILDCADVLYSARILFSAEHGLPFAIKDSTGGSKQVSNTMNRFDKYKDQAQRVRSFMVLIYNLSSSHTLPSDTFPVAINPQWVRPGGLLRADAESHHSLLIKEIQPTGIIRFSYSSRPARSALRQRLGIPSMGFLFKGGLKAERQSGFRYFRQPQYLGKPVTEVPGYSLEQYSIPAATWRVEVQNRLAKTAETTDQRLQRLLTDSCELGRDRVTAVNEGLAALSKMQSTACMDAKNYDDFSTPNRDERLRDSFEDLELAYHEIQTSRAPVSAKLMANASEIVERDDQTIGIPVAKTFCPVEFVPGTVISLGELRKRSRTLSLSSNPHDPLEIRWGNFPAGTKSKRARSCPTFE